MVAALNAIPGGFSKANPRTWFATLRHDPITIGILFVVIAIIAVMWIAVEAKITQARATKISDVQRENANLARAFEEHTIRTLEYVNEIVLSIQKQYEAKGRRFDLQTFYKEARPNLAVVRNAVITDETGQIVLSTEPAPRLSLADREHIKVHTGVGNQEMFISKPVLGRVNKQFSIIATRRANKPDGSYAGVVGVAIEPGYFSTFYQEVDLGSRGIVTLVGTDGIVRAHLSRDSTLLGQDISQAKSFQRLTGTPTVVAETYVSRSAVDNVERIYASRRVRGYPLLVFVGTATNESLKAFTADAHADRVAMSLATVVIGIFAIFLVAFNLRRRQAQAALHASAWQTHALLDGIPDRSWLKDAQGRYQAINRAEEQAHGIPAAQIIGKNALEFRPAHEARGVNEEDRAAMASSVPLRFERRSNLGDSWSEIIKAPICTEQGEVVGMVGISRDITERKRLEILLIENEQHLKALIETSPVGVFEADRDGKCVFVNARWSEITGLSFEQAKGDGWSAAVYANDRDKVYSEWTSAVGEKRPFRLEYRFQKSDGEIVWVIGQSEPYYSATGKLLGHIGAITDITDLNLTIEKLHQSEALNDSVLNSLSAHVAVLDQNGFIIAVNEAWRTFAQSNGAPVNLANPMGVNYLEVCQRAPDYYHGEAASAVESGIRAVLRGEQSSFLLEYPYHSPYEQRWFQLRATPLHGSRSGVVISHENITPRKMAEAAHASLEAQLRESQKMQAIGTLAGGIAHDFNNALATILGNAELARQDSAGNPPALESLEEIRKAGTRARNLVQQILSFSRRQPTERKPIDLAPVVTEATRLLRATLPARLSLEVRCDDVPLVLADMSQIEQVLINLATNAMQAMHNGPGRISIRLDTVPLDAAITGTHLGLQAMRARHPERTLRITVSDTGPGMDAATKERVFEPFFTTKPVGEGTGLGLSVVHGIVHGHEGAITVDSEPGTGTTFTVYLPVAEAEASTQPLSTSAETSPPVPGPEGGPRILYLDDDESLVYLVERLLKRRGYRVAAYTQQEEALQALRADPADFDLVLTDYNMPGMSGLEVARELRAIRPELPVVVTSGFIDETLHNEAAAAGVREVFFKADSVDVFCDAVQRLAQKVQQKTA